MSDFNDEIARLTDDEAKAEFARLFPQGWAGADVLAELAPQGWDSSLLAKVYHPSAEVAYEEELRIHRNLSSLFRQPDSPPPSPEPTKREFEPEYAATEVDQKRECQEIIGQCLWDIFSDNHVVRADYGREIDLGSMRGGGGFLAEVLNSQGGPPPLPRAEMPPDLMAQLFPPMENADPKVAEFMADMRREMIGDGNYTYLDFYMGTHMVAGRVDLQPVYEMIFRRMYKLGMDWEYAFPKIGLVDFRPLKKKLDEQARGDDAEFEGYDPSAAFEEEQQETERDEEIAKMRASLDEGNREAMEAALDQPPPTTVRAYQTVYGDFPTGWPPDVNG
jgi:hypothetical protein